MNRKITYDEMKALRRAQWGKQKERCPILGQKIPFDKAVMDHKHKTKKERIGDEGKGLLRGVLHAQANSWEGKVTNAFVRYGMHKFNISLPEALRNLANYIENPPIKGRFIHPDENPRPKKLGKREFNRILKYYFEIFPKRKKLPEFPKSGKISKEFKECLKIIDEKIKAKKND